MLHLVLRSGVERREVVHERGGGGWGEVSCDTITHSSTHGPRAETPCLDSRPVSGRVHILFSLFPFSLLKPLAVGLTTRRGKSESPPATQGLKDGVDDGIRKTGGMRKSESAAFHLSLSLGAVRCRCPTPDWLLIPTRFLFPTVSSVESKILASNNTSACFSKISLESSPLTSFRQTFLNPSWPTGGSMVRHPKTPVRLPCHSCLPAPRGFTYPTHTLYPSLQVSPSWC